MRVEYWRYFILILIVLVGFVSPLPSPLPPHPPSSTATKFVGSNEGPEKKDAKSEIYFDLRLDETSSVLWDTEGSSFKRRMVLSLTPAAKWLNREGEITCLVKSDGHEQDFEQVNFRQLKNVSSPTPLSLRSLKEHTWYYGFTYHFTCRFSFLLGEETYSKKIHIPLGPPKFTPAKIVKLRTMPEKYLLGLVLEKGIWPIAPELKAECQLRSTAGDIWYTSLSLPKGPSLLSTISQDLDFLQIDEELLLHPGDYRIRCQLTRGEGNYLVSTLVLYMNLTVPPPQPLLEMVQIKEFPQGEGGYSLSVQVRNLGLAFEPLSFTLDCRVEEGPEEGNVIWSGTDEFSATFPVGIPVEFSLDTKEESGMNLVPGLEYRALCELFPISPFKVVKKAPLIYRFKVW